MKTGWMIALIACALVLGARPSQSCAQGCLEPLKPIPPLGCRDLIGQCICDGQGRCSWIWTCVK